MRPERQTAIVVALRLVLRLLAGAHPHPLGEEVRGDTRVALPEGFHGFHRNVLTGVRSRIASSVFSFDQKESRP